MIAGFEPRLGEQAAGNTVWGGISLVKLAEPPATLTYAAVWPQGERPLIQRSLDTAAQLASEAGWR